MVTGFEMPYNLFRKLTDSLPTVVDKELVVGN
jgi:hypothetical protein